VGQPSAPADQASIEGTAQALLQKASSYYVVRAIDTSGNVSAPSAEAAGTAA
jgi:hypothetical protein